VVRCFQSDEIIHVAGSVDPKRDIEIINLELILADLSQIEKKINSISAKAKAGDKKLTKELEVFVRIREALQAGQPVRSLDLSEQERELIKEFSLLTIKPVLYVANVDETGSQEQVAIVEKIAAAEGAKVVKISSKLEAEIAELSDEDAKTFMAEMGIKESALNRLIHSCYELLNLITFFTTGEDESRAWTIARGTKAPQAAGQIHSDMEKGFIALETISTSEMLKCGSYNVAREKGLLRTEGKSYVVQDGDIVIVRFNV